MTTSQRSPRPLLTIPEQPSAYTFRSTVRRRIWDGERPAVRLGSGPQAPVRVGPDELDQWLRNSIPRTPGNRGPAGGAASQPRPSRHGHGEAA